MGSLPFALRRKVIMKTLYFILFVALNMHWTILEVEGQLPISYECTDEDAVYTRGPKGSCNFDCDCHECAPYCSTSGFCQTTSRYGSNTRNGCRWEEDDGERCFYDDYGEWECIYYQGFGGLKRKYT